MTVAPNNHKFCLMLWTDLEVRVHSGHRPHQGVEGCGGRGAGIIFLTLIELVKKIAGFVIKTLHYNIFILTFLTKSGE